VVYSKGSQFDLNEVNIKETVEQAKNVDYVIVCIGEDAYAESPGVIDELELPEVQQKLVTALYQTGKPVILVLVEGRPRIIRKIEEGAKGIVMAYVPGSQGHIAIAEVLFGEVNPSGKLPFTYPKYSGDIILYDHKYSDKVTELSAGVGGEGGYKPQWPFGYGLSYTKFEYSNLKLDTKTLKGSGSVKVSVDIKNTGSRAGKEAVELYTRDHFASVTPSSQRLRKFKKISLNPGQTMTVEFILDKNDLAFIGVDEKTFVTEPGGFDVMVGNLKETFNYEE
jgi:beta-glucosidase